MYSILLNNQQNETFFYCLFTGINKARWKEWDLFSLNNCNMLLRNATAPKWFYIYFTWLYWCSKVFFFNETQIFFVVE